MKSRFSDVAARDDKDNHPELSAFTADEIREIGLAVADNPKANLAYNLSMFSRYACNTKDCVASNGAVSLELFRTTNPIYPGWGAMSEDDSEEFKQMKRSMLDVMKQNIERFAQGQEEYKQLVSHESANAFEKALSLKYDEKAAQAAVPHAKAQMKEAYPNLDEITGAPFYNTFLTTTARILANEMKEPERQARDELIAKVAEKAYGEMANKNWHEILADSFQHDLLPAFKTHCRYWNESLYEQCIDRINEALGEEPRNAMR